MSSKASYEVLNGIIWLIACPIAVILMLAYVSILRKRCSQPLTDREYLSDKLKAFGVFLKGFTIILSTIQSCFWPLNTECRGISIAVTFGWRISVIASSCTYILYLYQLYPPKIGYNARRLWNIAALIIVGNVGIMMALLVQFFPGFGNYDADDKFPYFCAWSTVDLDPDTPQKPSFNEAIVGLLIIIFDLSLSAGAIHYFNKPYNKLLLKIKEQGGGDDYNENKTYKSMIQTGRKYKFIVTTVAGTRIFWMCLLFFISQRLGGAFAGIDFLISMISLMLMTPNPNDKWYNCLCSCCIKTQGDVLTAKEIHEIAQKQYNQNNQVTEMTQDDTDADNKTNTLQPAFDVDK